MPDDAGAVIAPLPKLIEPVQGSTPGVLRWPFKDYRGFLLLLPAHKEHPFSLSMWGWGGGFDVRMDLSAEQAAEIRDCLTSALHALAGAA